MEGGEKHAGGRPLKFESVEELETRINEYFESCYTEDGDIVRPLTLSGLAAALDVDRKTLRNYGERDEFLPTIRRARLKVEAFAEEQLFRSSGPVAGVQFSLRNNFDWTEKTEQEITGTLNTTTQSLDGMTPEERRARIDELNRRRGAGAAPTAGA